MPALSQALALACARYNDKPHRALRSEFPKLDEDGVTVWSDGDGFQPRSIRDLLGWIAAGQWDADGPDESIAPNSEVRPAHARLAAWWRRRNFSGD